LSFSGAETIFILFSEGLSFFSYSHLASATADHEQPDVHDVGLSRPGDNQTANSLKKIVRLVIS
jgi:hypothetical protein